MLRRYKALLTLPLAFFFSLQILVASPALAGLTLCIEDDGRIGFEAKNDTCCAPLTVGEKDLAISQLAEDCDSCIDVSLGDSDSPIQISSDVQKFVAFFGTSGSIERLEPSKIMSSVYLSGDPPSLPSLMAIQTIVLRV